MKNIRKITGLFLVSLLILLLITPSIIAQSEPPADPQTSVLWTFLTSAIGVYFATFVAFVVLVTTLTSLLNKLFQKDGWFKQKLSWFIGAALGLFAFLLNLGIFEPLLWWEAILTGIIGGLVSNGVYDIPGVWNLLVKLGLENLPINKNK